MSTLYPVQTTQPNGLVDDMVYGSRVLVPNSGDLANIERRFIALRTGGTGGVTASTKTLSTVAAAKAAAAANPYPLTPVGLRAALATLPSQLIDVQYFIDTTDPSALIFAAAGDVIRFQPYRTNLNNLIFGAPANAVNQFFQAFSAPINFYADPTVFFGPFTVDGVSVIETTDAVSLLKTLSNAAWTFGVNALKGMIIGIAGTGRFGVIASNTATSIECAWAGGSAFGGTASSLAGQAITIWNYGGEIRCTSNNQGIFASEPGAAVGFLGLNLNTTAAGSPWAPNASQQATNVVACRINRMQLLRANFVAWMACYITSVGSTGRYGLLRNGSSPEQYTNFYENIDFDQLVSGNGPVSFAASIMRGCSPVGHGTVQNAQGEHNREQSLGLFALNRCLIDAGTSHGLQYTGGPKGFAKNVKITNCVGSAVKAIGGGTLHLDTVSGTGNTRYGIEGDGGPQVRVEANVDVAGALGEMKSGNRATRTWVDFRSATPANSNTTKDEHDVPGQFRQPLKFAFTGLAGLDTYDITTLAGSPPAIQNINGLRVVAGAAAFLGTYTLTDAGGTPISTAAGTVVGVATLSDDGKTITFPAGAAVTEFTISYLPVAGATTGTRIWQA